MRSDLFDIDQAARFHAFTCACLFFKYAAFIVDHDGAAGIRGLKKATRRHPATRVRGNQVTVVFLLVKHVLELFFRVGRFGLGEPQCERALQFAVVAGYVLDVFRELAQKDSILVRG